MKKIIPKLLCIIFGIVMSVAGLYFFHPQYLCYEYTPLLFILGIVSALGCGLISVPIFASRGTAKKKIVLKALGVSLLVALATMGLMLVINLVFGKGSLELASCVITVCLAGIVTAVLSLVAVIKVFNSRIIKAILSIIIIAGLLAGGYLYAIPQYYEVKYSNYIAPTPILNSASSSKMRVKQ